MAHLIALVERVQELLDRGPLRLREIRVLQHVLQGDLGFAGRHVDLEGADDRIKREVLNNPNQP